jgi:ribosomal protein L34E
MPYLSCPGCRLTVSGAASHSTIDACPSCGSPLEAADRVAGVARRWRVADLRRTVGRPAEQQEVAHGHR